MDQLLLIISSVLNLLMPKSASQISPSPSPSVPTMEIVAANLETPWSLAILPDNTMLITERSGQLIQINQVTKSMQSIQGLPEIIETSEGGLLGLALHPQFTSNQTLYVYLTTRTAGKLTNQVVRYQLDNNRLINKTVIINNIEAAQNHNGGRLAFGPDKYLYILTGDAQSEHLAQDINSLNGKVLRIQDDGSIPLDNPFRNAVYAYGFRNPQGMAWDGSKRLWVTDHGPSGSQTGCDEINIVEKGSNYGWPIVRCSQSKEGTITPVVQSGKTDTWAPANLVIIDNRLYIPGLRGQALYEAVIEGDSLVQFEQHFKNIHGRLRALTASNNQLYVGTSNRDSRGNPRSNDDKIIRMDIDSF